MMEHIKQHDWCQSNSDMRYFVNAEDLDNSVTSRIIRNVLKDPLISTDDEEEQCVFDWAQIFKKKNKDILHNLFVPGLRPLPPYPRLSTLTVAQQYSMLKILSYENPHVLPSKKFAKPSKQDYDIFQEVKEVYETEKKEYIQWAKTLWTNDHCTRALRPKPCIETVYEAEYQLKAYAMRSFPRHYEMAAQISLDTDTGFCDMICVQNLHNVDTRELPELHYEQYSTRKLSVPSEPAVPAPCERHPCRFVLPGEESQSVLPLTELHRQLAQYAGELGVRCVAGEGALRCLLRHDLRWTLPVSVCRVVMPDGDEGNVVVLGSEMDPRRVDGIARTRRALRHLLRDALVPPGEKARTLQRHAEKIKMQEKSKTNKSSAQSITETVDVSSDEEDSLYIELGENFEVIDIKQEQQDSDDDCDLTLKELAEQIKSTNNDSLGIYKCTCKDSQFPTPAPRSWQHWRMRCEDTGSSLDLIVHANHHTQEKGKKVVIETVPEYQPECGGAQVSQHGVHAAVLSLLLRGRAEMLSVRVDASVGDVITLEKMTLSDLLAGDEGVLRSVSRGVHSSLQQLQGLLPGRYLLHHEPQHRANAMLYVGRDTGAADHISLERHGEPAAPDEAGHVVWPALSAVLLPYHKSRRIVPLLFPVHEGLLPRRTAAPTAPRRAPPRAILLPAEGAHSDTFPKKKKKNRGKNRARHQ